MSIPEERDSLKFYLKENTFLWNEWLLTEDFVPDDADLMWHWEQKKYRSYLTKSAYWTPQLYKISSTVYKDAVTESGMGQTCYPVIVDHIDSTTNSVESDKIFSKSINLYLSSCLIPYFKTSSYYNELVPLADSISRLWNPELGKSGKRTALAVLRSVF